MHVSYALCIYLFLICQYILPYNVEYQWIPYSVEYQWIVNWKECERKRCWCTLKYRPEIQSSNWGKKRALREESGSAGLDMNTNRPQYEVSGGIHHLGLTFRHVFHNAGPIIVGSFMKSCRYKKFKIVNSMFLPPPVWYRLLLLVSCLPFSPFLSHFL
jgi:hypothetical protein